MFLIVVLFWGDHAISLRPFCLHIPFCLPKALTQCRCTTSWLGKSTGKGKTVTHWINLLDWIATINSSIDIVGKIEKNTDSMMEWMFYNYDNHWRHWPMLSMQSVPTGFIIHRFWTQGKGPFWTPPPQRPPPVAFRGYSEGHGLSSIQNSLWT